MKRKINKKNIEKWIKSNVRSSLRFKITIYFGILFILIISLTVLLEIYGIPFTNVDGLYQNESSSVFRQLNSIADGKKDWVVEWMTERIKDSKNITESDIINSSLSDISRSVIESADKGGNIDTAIKRKKIQANYNSAIGHLKKISDIYGVYKKINIIEKKSGRIILSTSNNETGRLVTNQELDRCSPGLSWAFEKNAYTGDIDFVLTLSMNSVHYPQGSKNSYEFYLMIFMIPEDLTSPPSHDVRGLGKTGEIVLVNQNREILKKLNYPVPGIGEVNPLEYKIKALPAVMAAKGKEGIIEAEDYRGVKVFAAYRYIPISKVSGWGMVFKKDKGEVFRALNLNIIVSVLFGFITVILLVILTFFIAKNIAKPLAELNEVAKEIEDGNLDKRADVKSSNEIGILAGSINSMADKISGSQKNLQKLVDEKTNDLMMLNKQLRQEIDEHEKTEYELRLNESLISNAIDGSPIGVVLIQLDGKISRVNKAFCEITKYSEAELLNKSFNDILHTDDLSMRSELMENLINGQSETAQSFNRLIRKDGKVIDCQFDTFLLRNDDSKPLFFFTQVQDITLRIEAENQSKNYSKELETRVKERTKELEKSWKEAEEAQIAMRYLLEDVNQTGKELEEANINLTKANKELESFSYTISHDLRAPLRAIQGFSKKLERLLGNALDDETRRVLSVIMKNTERMNQLINDLLEFAKLGRTPIAVSNVDMNDLVVDILRQMEPETEGRKIKFEIQSLQSVQGDARLLYQVFFNLIANSIKFTRKKRKAVITIGCRENENEIVYFVKDNGAGFSMKYADKLFQVFQRLHSATEFEGTGVGLAIIHRIVDKHGGRVWTEAKVNRGASFYFALNKVKDSAGV